jgi:hypothetical protein
MAGLLGFIEGFRFQGVGGQIYFVPLLPSQGETLYHDCDTPDCRHPQTLLV